VINQPSDFVITFDNNSGQDVTITQVVVDVGGSGGPITYQLAGCTPGGTFCDQDFISFDITWIGSLLVPNGSSATLTIEGGFVGAAPGTACFGNVSITSSPQLTPASRSGPCGFSVN
jgi:hypothetical protein